jgi:hypothetical protein
MLFSSQISNFSDNFSQNQEAKASSQLSEKNHWSRSIWYNVVYEHAEISVTITIHIINKYAFIFISNTRLVNDRATSFGGIQVYSKSLYHYFRASACCLNLGLSLNIVISIYHRYSSSNTISIHTFKYQFKQKLIYFC